MNDPCSFNASSTNRTTRSVVFPLASSEEAKNAISGFVVGSDGKLKLAPWPGAIKRPSSSASKNDASTSNKRLTRKIVPLEPLNLREMAAALEAQIPERRQTTLAVTKSKPVTTRRSPHVRKDVVYKPPSKKRLSFGMKKPWSPKKPKIPPTRKSRNFADSPLLDIDEAVSILRDKRVVETPQIAVTLHQTPPTLRKCDPNITNSAKEFIELEKSCAAPMPITSSSGSTKESKISAVRILLEKNQAQLDSLKLMVENISANQKMLYELITQLEFDDEDKENVNGKTTNKTIVKKTHDLRKFALNKMFAAGETQSPRTKKAVDLYNTVRGDCGILCTPKLGRNVNEGDTPAQCSAKEALSRKIENQCLLLQDTPRP